MPSDPGVDDFISGSFFNNCGCRIFYCCLCHRPHPSCTYLRLLAGNHYRYDHYLCYHHNDEALLCFNSKQHICTGIWCSLLCLHHSSCYASSYDILPDMISKCFTISRVILRSHGCQRSKQVDMAHWCHMASTLAQVMSCCQIAPSHSH